MKLIGQSKDSRKYRLEKNEYSADFTLINMGNYIGYSGREWYEKAKEVWKAMAIDVNSQNDRRSLHSEYLVDKVGVLFRALLTDSKGIRRVRIYYSDSTYYLKEEEEALVGKGLSPLNGRWVQDIIMVSYSGTDVQYYYDESTGKFVDGNGQELEENTILSNYELIEVLTKAGENVVKKFIEQRSQLNGDTPKEVNDDDLEFI